jgi:dihydroflavonol-4-reductase
VTRRARSNHLLLRKHQVEFREAALEDVESLKRAASGCDVIFMAAGHYPRYSLDVRASVSDGVRGIRNACAASLAAGVERLIYTSSVGSLATVEGRAANEMDVGSSMPEGSIYRAVKWTMEREVERAAARGLGAITLLPGGCLGPGDLRVGTGAFLVGVVRGELPWWVDGSINLVDVADIARAHVAAVTASPGSRFCVAGRHVRVSWLLQYAAERYGGRVPTVCLPAAEARRRANADEREAAPFQRRVPIPREIVDLVTTGQVVSIAKSEAELGFVSRSLDETLDRTYAWFARLGLLPRQPRRIHVSIS